MKFRYLRDPLFLVCCALYGANRWGLKAHVDSRFLHSWFDDLLLVPCAIPVMLWLFRAWRLREHDEAPGMIEMGWIIAVWALLFEWAGPMLFEHATGDWRDVAMYFAGGIVAWSWWGRRVERTAARETCGENGHSAGDRAPVREDARPPIMEAGAA